MAKSVSEVSDSHFDLRSTEISEEGMDHLLQIKNLINNLQKP